MIFTLGFLWAITFVLLGCLLMLHRDFASLDCPPYNTVERLVGLSFFSATWGLGAMLISVLAVTWRYLP